MTENKIVFHENIVCATCLSYHRKLKPISSCDILITLCATVWKDIKLTDNDYICWECIAAMNRVGTFRRRALQAQTTLSQLKVKQSYVPLEPLSSFFTVCAYTLSIDPEQQLNNSDQFVKEESNFAIISSDTVIAADKNDCVKTEDIYDDEDMYDQEPADLYDQFVTGENDDSKHTKSKKISTLFDTRYLSVEEMWQHRARKKNSTRYRKAMFKCDNCMKAFNNSLSYSKHIQKHQMGGDFVCDICKLSFKEKKLLARHITSHFILYKCKLCKFDGDMSSVSIHYSRSHKTKQCKACGESFQTRELYKQHWATHTSKRTCELCGVKFSNEKFLNLHKHDEKGQAYFECNICEKQFKKKERIWEHIKAHEHRDNSETFCVECGIHFSTKATFSAHINKTLKHASADDFKYKCPHCDKRFALQNVMQSHVEAMHEMSPEYYCAPCDKRYFSKSGLIRHKDNVHRGRVAPRNKVCDICGKAFTSNALLKQHKNIHLGIRQFVCSMCPAAYVAHGALYNHIQNVHKHRKKVKASERVLKVHSKRWTLKCPHCEDTLRGTKLLESHINLVHKKNADYVCRYCSKRFYGEVSLQYHEDRHKGNICGPRPKPTPARNKICDVCGKAFFTNAVLNQHKNIHSGLRPFACTSCPKTFNASGALYMHVAVVHDKVKTWRKRPRSGKGIPTITDDLDLN